MRFPTPSVRQLALLVLAALALLTVSANPGNATTTSGESVISPVFQHGTLNAEIEAPTSLAFGPDGRLYVAGLREIKALSLDPTTQEVLDV